MDSETGREVLDAQTVLEAYAAEVAALTQRAIFAEARVKQLEHQLNQGEH